MKITDIAHREAKAGTWQSNDFGKKRTITRYSTTMLEFNIVNHA